jgi:hypothetical protein
MVRWIAIPVVLALTACGHKTKGTTTPGEVPDAGPILVKQTLVHFGTENTTPQADVPHTKIWLVVTNETGSAKNYPIDEIGSDCTSQPGGEMEALGTLDCQLDGTGASYIAVARGDEIILLRKAIRPGEDDNDYEELSRVQVPVGSKLAFSP